MTQFHTMATPHPSIKLPHCSVNAYIGFSINLYKIDFRKALQKQKQPFIEGCYYYINKHK